MSFGDVLGLNSPTDSRDLDHYQTISVMNSGTVKWDTNERTQGDHVFDAPHVTRTLVKGPCYPVNLHFLMGSFSSDLVWDRLKGTECGHRHVD